MVHLSDVLREREHLWDKLVAILDSNLTFWTNPNLLKCTILFTWLWCDIRSILVSGHNDVMVRYVTLNAPILSDVSPHQHSV